MSKKLILFLMVLLFGSTSFLRADEVVIGDGTATSYYVPFNSLWGYSFVEQVYLADEIGMAGTINSISFNMNETDAAFTSEFDIFMKNVERTQFASGTDFESVTAGDMVFSGEITFQPGWTTITLNAPFAYDGTSNLMIGVHEKTSGYSTRYFYYTAVEGGLISGHSDSADPNPYDMSSYSGTTYMQNYRANIKIDITPGGSGGGGTVTGELTVNDGTVSNSYVPVYGFYADAYLKAEMVYPAEELATMSGMTINSITFYTIEAASEAWGSTFRVFMKEVGSTTISDFTGSDDAVIVYEGELDGTGEEMAITFSTPYNYAGGNLLVGVYNTTTGSYKSVTWAGETVDGASVQGYNYSNLTSVSPTQRNFLPKATFAYSGEGPQPGSLVITPSTFNLGERPTNGWMEPMSVRIQNNGEPVTITAIMSNTSGNNAIYMDPAQIEDRVLNTNDEIEFTVATSLDVTEGEYAEQFTMFVVNNDRDITVVPATATIYEAGEADIVETAKTLVLNYTGGVAEFTETPANLHANYIGAQGMMAADAVYYFELAKDSKFSVNGGIDSFIGIYNFVEDLHLTTAVEPVAYATGEMNEAVLLAGEYYMLVAGDNITTITGTVEQFPAPGEITYVAPSPEDGATEVAAPVTLAWQGGVNATQYQVLFGTSPVNMTIAQDWTMIDYETVGTYTVTSLDSNTKYFWQINVKNSEGTVEGPRWGFTSTLTRPHTVTASAQEIFTDESTLIKWKHSSGQGGFTGEITVCDGTATNSYVPVYGLWVDDFTRSEMIYPAEMLEEMEGGDITSLTFYLSSPATAAWAPAQFNVYMMEVEGTTLSSYYGSADATIVYSGALDGTNATMTITLDTPYTYEGGNLLLGIEEPVEGTYKSASFYGIEATGASASGYNSSALANVTFNQRNFLPKTTFTCGDAKSNRTFEYYNVYCDDVKVNTEPIYEKQYLLSNLEYMMGEGHAITVTAVYYEGESTQSDPVYVKVSGYGKFQGDVTSLVTEAGGGEPLAGVTVKFNGKDEFQNNVMFEGTTNGQGHYIINGVKAGNYVGTATLDGMEPKNSDPVTLAYNTTETVDFVMHEVYTPVLSVVAEEMDPELARVRWSRYVDIPVPTPGGGGGGQSTGDEFFENFDNSAMPAGWTAIDADGDGFNWCIASSVMTTGYGHNASTDCVLSQSYSNSYGALNPNNFLVTPQVTVGSNSTFSFYACAQDASYAAEHFGVAVSTTTPTAAAFEMVQEWTLTAKGSGVMAPGRDGQTRAQGTWYEYNVDLSAYAGQQIYIALRHFNCTDMFYIDVDDIALSNSRGNRNIKEYAVYRKAILKETELTDEDSVYFGTVADTLYADFGWNNVEPGLYLYGVSAIYPTPVTPRDNNRDEVIIGESTGTSTYVPAYNLYNYSCTNQIYTGEEIGGAGTITSIAFMPNTVNDASRTLKVYMANTDKTVFSSTSDWVPVTDADLVYQGAVNWTANAWSTIELTTPFEFDGTNLCLVVCDISGDWTSSNYYQVFDAAGNQAIYAYRDASAYDPSAPGTGYLLAKKNVIKLDITYGGGTGNDNNVTPITWSNVLPKEMETSVKVNVHMTTGSYEGATVTFRNTFENILFTAQFDEADTAVIDNFRKGEYVVTANLDGYMASFSQTDPTFNNIEMSIWEDAELDVYITEIFKPVDDIAVSSTGFARWTEVVPVDRIAEKYHVLLNGVFVDETTDNFYQFDDDMLTVGQTYTASVAVVYTTGMSAFKTTTFTYVGCEGVNPQIENLAATNAPGDHNIILTWGDAQPNPNPNPNPNPGPQGGWTEGFENGMPAGWTTVDGNNDGYTWCMTSAIPSTWTYYASLTLDWYRTGTNAICSGSYINGVGAITPNDFLVTSQVTPSAGSTFSFYAAACDASYPAEHFGVAVSTSGTSASDFTMIQSWTLTAKESTLKGGRESRDGDGAKLGSWHQYSVDLSAYAGQNIYIAIRHFECNDQYIMCVDDIEFTADAKLANGTLAAAGKGFGEAASMNRDWLYYDSGTNSDAIGLTSGGGFYWGIMFPANSYEGTRVTKIAYFDYAAHSGSFMIYNGGTSAPGTLLYTQAYTVSGSETYLEIELNEPVEIDNTQSLWLVMHNNNGQYVAAIDETSAGVANASCISTDGSTWYNTVSSATSGQIDGNWNLRIFTETGGTPATALVPNKYNIFVDGEIVGATAQQTYTYEVADWDEHDYAVMWVSANYDMSCLVEITYAGIDAVEENNEVINSIYPNPTSAELYINATAMRHISVYNAMGQMVYDQDVNSDNVVLHMGQYEAGVYMVNVITENGTSVKRITVAK